MRAGARTESSGNEFAFAARQSSRRERATLRRYRRCVRSRSQLARDGEDVAASYLARHGWTIVGRNVRCGRTGEIDIIAERAGVLAFVEVKTRSSARFGSPGEAVTWQKQARIRAMARQYLISARPGAGSVRFDVIEVRWRGDAAAVTHLEGCF